MNFPSAKSGRLVQVRATMIVLAALGCGDQKKKPINSASQATFRTTVAATDTLRSIPLGRNDLISRPWSIGANAEIVIVTDKQPPHHHVIDARTGRHIKSFGTTGEGPGQFSGATQPMRASMSSDTLRLFDGPRRRITSVPWLSLTTDLIAPRYSIFRLDTLSMYLADGPDGHGNYRGMQDDYHSGTYPVRIDPNSRSVHRSEIRKFDAIALDSSWTGRAFAGQVCYSQHLGALIQPYYWAGGINVLGEQGRESKVFRVPFPYRPYVEADPRANGLINFFFNRPQVRRAYYDCAVTRRFHYALYEGALIGDWRKPVHLPAEVHVFDDAGRFVRAWVLDHQSNAFAIPDGDSLMFTIAEEDSGFVVRKTRLPRLR